MLHVLINRTVLYVFNKFYYTGKTFDHPTAHSTAMNECCRSHRYSYFMHYINAKSKEMHREGFFLLLFFGAMGGGGDGVYGAAVKQTRKFTECILKDVC